MRNTNLSSFATFLLAAMCLSAIGAAPAVAQDAKTLGVPHKEQNTLVWCWGASIAMVAEYYTGAPTKDCEALSLYDRSGGGAGLCCISPRLCHRGAYPQEIEFILKRVYRIPTTTQGKLSWTTVRAQIDRGHPVIAWFWNGPMSAHVVVIVGYDERGRTLVIHDPLYADPVHVSYDQFASDYGPVHNWSTSWTFENASAPGPHRGTGDGGRDDDDDRHDHDDEDEDDYDDDYDDDVEDHRRRMEAGVLACASLCNCDHFVGQAFFACRQQCEMCLAPYDTRGRRDPPRRAVSIPDLGYLAAGSGVGLVGVALAAGGASTYFWSDDSDTQFIGTLGVIVGGLAAVMGGLVAAMSFDRDLMERS